MNTKLIRLVLLCVSSSVSVSACAGEGGDLRTADDDLTGVAAFAGVGKAAISSDGRYAVVMREVTRGAPHPFRVVRVDLETGTEREVGVFDSDDWRSAQVVAAGGSFYVTTFNAGTELAADFALSRVVKPEGGQELFVAPHGGYYLRRELGAPSASTRSGLLREGAPEHDAGARNNGLDEVWREQSLLFVSTEAGFKYQKRRFDVASGTLGPEVLDPMPHPEQYGHRYDGKSLFAATVTNDGDDRRVEIAATDMVTGRRSALGLSAHVKDAKLQDASDYNQGGLFAPEGSPFVVFFGATTGPGSTTVAHVVRKEGGEPVAFEGVTNAAFEVAVGDGPGASLRRIAYDVVAADGGAKIAILRTRRSVLLDPATRAVTELGRDASQVGDAFWSAADARLVSGKGETLFTSDVAESDALRRVVAGDGETVWELRRDAACDGGRAAVRTTRRKDAIDLGCQPVSLGDVISRVGATGKLAFSTGETVRVLGR